MSESQTASRNSHGSAGQPRMAANDPRHAPRVLVVDDDPSLRVLMHETLAKAGFDVTEAATGEEGVEQSRELSPDLVLLDINMPQMDGITACRAMREQSDRDFAIIMVAGVNDVESIKQAYAAGATDFILRPLNWPLFQRRLDSVIAEWNRADDLDDRSERASLLGKVVPEEVILVARGGVVIEDLKNPSDTVESAPTTLEQLYGEEVSQRMQQRISSVLTTRRHSNLEFPMALHGAFRNFEAQLLVTSGDGVIIVIQDVTGGDQERGEIYDLAYFDSATSFPNRHLFMRAAGEAITEARLRAARPVFFSLAFDNLPESQTRDKDIMRAIAERLNACLSHFGNVLKMGRPDDAVRAARIDSNHFMFVLQCDYDGSDTRMICDRIFRQMAGHVPLDNGTVTIVPRLGIARYSAADDGLAAVMHSARSAMLEALEQNKPFVNRSLHYAAQQSDGRDYASELRNALERDQLELFFQPRLAMPTGRVTSVEALLRWNHPTLGFVDVRELLHVARDNELIVPIGEWVLHQACEAASRWRVHPRPRISINLSQQEFSRRDLANRVIAVLEQTGLDPAGVELELAESMLMRNADDLNDLARLKETGASLVIDDFGTGHSSLANLRQYPVDALKIDQSFVDGLPGNHKDVAVCRVIVTMAHLFGMTAVAEGVETDAQLELLLELGCDEFQGFHLCRPLPANEIEQYLLDLR